MYILSGGYNTRYRISCPTLSGVPKPSQTFCAIGEVDLGFGGLDQTANANGWLVAPNPNQAIWKDTPALWNNNKVNLSNLDGSTVSVTLTNPDALRARIDQTGSTHDVMVGNGPQEKVDFELLRDRMLPGVLEYRTASDQE